MVFIEPQPIQFLPLQQQLYPDPNLPTENPGFAIHPVTGEWQDTDRLRSKYPWGGGASHYAFEQLPPEISPHHFLGTLVFGPVQSFLGAGQRLRDWAVASWLCHYLATATIYHWEKQEKLNSIELIKRLASLPNYIQKALEMRWGHIPPACPWGNLIVMCGDMDICGYLKRI